MGGHGESYGASGSPKRCRLNRISGSGKMLPRHGLDQTSRSNRVQDQGGLQFVGDGDLPRPIAPYEKCIFKSFLILRSFRGPILVLENAVELAAAGWLKRNDS